MRVIYIAGKYRGKTNWDTVQNIRHAEGVSRDLWAKGWAVICPHKNTALMDGLGDSPEGDHLLWLTGDLAILERCDAIYMLDNWKTSVGAMAEFELAKKLGLEIYYEERIKQAKMLNK